MSGLKCPVCCSDNVYEYFYLRKNDLIAQKCTDCSHVFVQNSPISSSNAADYYTMDDFDGNRKLQSNELYTNYYCQCRADYRQFLQSSQVLRQFKEKINYLNDCFQPLLNILFFHKYPHNTRRIFIIMIIIPRKHTIC